MHTPACDLAPNRLVGLNGGQFTLLPPASRTTLGNAAWQDSVDDSVQQHDESGDTTTTTPLSFPTIKKRSTDIQRLQQALHTNPRSIDRALSLASPPRTRPLLLRRLPSLLVTALDSPDRLRPSLAWCLVHNEHMNPSR